MMRTAVLTILGVVLMTAAPANADPDPLLVDVLGDLSDDAWLELTRSDDAFIRGHPAGLVDDHLLLVAAPIGGAPQPPVDVPLDQIVRVRQLKSGADAGFRNGALFGALLGGILGFAAGTGASSMFGGEADLETGVLTAGIGAAAFGLIGGVVGAGAGALGDAWYTLYTAPTYRPEPEPAVAPPPPAPSSLRASLVAGPALGKFGHAGDYDLGWHGQLALLNTTSARCELGPELGMSGLRYPVSGAAGGDAGETIAQPVWSLALVGSYRFGDDGWRPYVAAGAGLYIAEDPFFGVSFGGGLIRHRPLSTDIKIEVRGHLNLAGDGPLNPDSFFTAGAGFSFGL